MVLNFVKWLSLSEADAAAAAAAPAPAAAPTGGGGGGGGAKGQLYAGGVPRAGLKPSDDMQNKGSDKKQDYMANDWAKSQAAITKSRNHTNWQSQNIGCGGRPGKCAGNAQGP